MKKIAIIMVVLLLAIAVVGCSSSSEEEVLRVGMELKWPPFETTDESGNPKGISVLIAEELGAHLGREVEIVDLPFGSLIPALETDKIDVILASMSITDERKEKINFSEPYMYFKILSVVNNESGIEGYDDIFTKEGITFVAPKSFATLDLARAKANNPVILEFDDKATATFELANGNADIFMVDAVSAVSIASNYDNLNVIYEPVDVSPIGMGVRKTDTELLEKLNEFISKTEELGVNDKVRDQYNDTLMEMVGKGYEFYLNED
jgi:polar amino acid transport system substrate-binding protein